MTMGCLRNFPQALRAFALGSLVAGAAVVCRAQAPTPPQRTPVIVELFTSEGCSSCPPADKLLALMDSKQPLDGIEILALEEHVDYWNHDGWFDPFSSAEYTVRQQDYADKLHVREIYTPQMIVDGATQFNGTDSVAAKHALLDAANRPHIALTISQATVAGHDVHASVSLSPAAATAPNPHAELYAVLVQPSATTVVKQGENGGKTLQHAAVVRTLKRIGTVGDLASNAKAFSLAAPRGASLAGFRVVVFAQAPGSGPIIGAATMTVTAP